MRHARCGDVTVEHRAHGACTGACASRVALCAVWPRLGGARAELDLQRDAGEGEDGGEAPVVEGEAAEAAHKVREARDELFEEHATALEAVHFRSAWAEMTLNQADILSTLSKSGICLNYISKT